MAVTGGLFHVTSGQGNWVKRLTGQISADVTLVGFCQGYLEQTNELHEAEDRLKRKVRPE